MRYQPIDPQLFVKNRERLATQLKGNALAIFFGNDAMPRSADQHFPFKQHSDLFYFTGAEQASTILILFPNATLPEHQELLLIVKGDENTKIWQGERLTKLQAQEISGIKNILWVEQYKSIMHELMRQTSKIYLNFGENISPLEQVVSRDRRMGAELMQQYPLHKYRRLPKKLRQLRMIKSEEEIALIKKAIEITASGFDNILTGIHPNIWEYQLEAILSGSFLNLGAGGHAYEPIVASGASACILHYVNNDRPCRDGELVLLDFGAEYANYAADISRTIPVSGRYSVRQGKIYQAVLDIFKETRAIMVPGITMKELNLEVGKMMNHALIDLGLLDKKDIPSIEDKEQPYRQYFMHGIGHHLGLDVHDISDRAAPLQKGMVLTCEPGIYIAEENIGVRIENDILISEKEPIDLAQSIPIEIEEIESLMQQKT